MRRRAIALGLGLFVAFGAAAGCSGVDKNDNDNENQNNNNTPAGNGSLTGQVSSTVTCDASPEESDCAGTLYLVLMAEDPVTNPYQTPEAFEIVSGVDLSSGSVSYTLDNIPAGQWYISGFLDDDGNASGALPTPDVGDPFSYPAPQVTIVADDTTTQNLTLTTRMP